MQTRKYTRLSAALGLRGVTIAFMGIVLILPVGCGERQYLAKTESAPKAPTRVVAKMLELESWGPGEWQDVAMCPEDTFANGYRMRVESPRGALDDTALNAIEMACTSQFNQTDGGWLHSHPGFWGEWGTPVYCPGHNSPNSSIVGGMLKVEPPLHGDNTSVNSLKVLCGDGSWIESDNPGPWGTWRRAATCDD